MKKKKLPSRSTTALPLIEISGALHRYAVLPNPESTSAVEEEPLIEEQPLLLLQDQEHEEKGYIQWKRRP